MALSSFDCAAIARAVQRAGQRIESSDAPRESQLAARMGPECAVDELTETCAREYWSGRERFNREEFRQQCGF